MQTCNLIPKNFVKNKIETIKYLACSDHIIKRYSSYDKVLHKLYLMLSFYQRLYVFTRSRKHRYIL